MQSTHTKSVPHDSVNNLSPIDGNPKKGRYQNENRHQVNAISPTRVWLMYFEWAAPGKLISFKLCW